MTRTRPRRAARSSARVLEGEQGAEHLAQRVAGMIGLAEAAAGVEEGFTAVRTLFEALDPYPTTRHRLR